MRSSARPRARRGSAMTFVIVIALIISGVVTACAWSAGMQSKFAGAFTQLDKAFYAAEAGLQRFAWYVKNHKNSTLSSPLNGTVGGYNYSVTWGTTSPFHIASTGSSGGVSYTLYQDVSAAFNPVTAIASIGDFDNKNIAVTGNVSTAGNYINSGNGSLNGDLAYGGTATNTSAVTGNITKATFDVIDFNSLTNQVKAKSTTKNATDVFDFGALPNGKKAYYVDGDVTDPVIIGGGTLLVNGNLTITSSTTLGSAANPV